jgi:hypothetical protein
MEIVFKMKKFNKQKKGWFCGDCHNHINPPETIENLINFMEKEKIDTISLCQGWLTDKKSAHSDNGEKLREFIEKASTENVKLYLGAEFPKTRFGHTCWWKFPGIKTPSTSYNSMHDIVYFDIAGINTTKYSNPADEIPFANESPMLKVQRWKKQGGINMVPHPTSWWLVNEKASLICTNIAVDFCFDLLGERIYDSLAVMGYDAEQIFYQNFWFHLLNEGYKISGSAETDGNINKANSHRIGDFRTYAYSGNENFERNAFLKAICKGNSFMTSGPMLYANVGDKYLPGSIIKSKKEQHTLNVEVEVPEDDYISWIVLYKNGKVEELIDLEKENKKYVKHEFILKPTMPYSWYIVKVYGKHHPLKKEYVDVMSYTELCKKEKHTEYQKVSSCAFTNPFYFQNSDFTEPKKITPSLTGKLIDKNTNIPIKNAEVKLIDYETILSITTSDQNGEFIFDNIPLTARIIISRKGCDDIEKNIYLEYPPLKNYFASIYSGKWALENKKLQPGQVPWEVFQFEKLKKLLQKLNWTLEI